MGGYKWLAVVVVMVAVVTGDEVVRTNTGHESVLRETIGDGYGVGSDICLDESPVIITKTELVWSPVVKTVGVLYLKTTHITITDVTTRPFGGMVSVVTIAKPHVVTHTTSVISMSFKSTTIAITSTKVIENTVRVTNTDIEVESIYLTKIRLTTITTTTTLTRTRYNPLVWRADSPTCLSHTTATIYFTPVTSHTSSHSSVVTKYYTGWMTKTQTVTKPAVVTVEVTRTREPCVGLFSTVDVQLAANKYSYLANKGKNVTLPRKKDLTDTYCKVMMLSDLPLSGYLDLSFECYCRVEHRNGTVALLGGDKLESDPYFEVSNLGEDHIVTIKDESEKNKYSQTSNHGESATLLARDKRESILSLKDSDLREDEILTESSKNETDSHFQAFDQGEKVKLRENDSLSDPDIKASSEVDSIVTEEDENMSDKYFPAANLSVNVAVPKEDAREHSLNSFVFIFKVLYQKLPPHELKKPGGRSLYALLEASNNSQACEECINNYLHYAKTYYLGMRQSLLLGMGGNKFDTVVSEAFDDLEPYLTEDEKDEEYHYFKDLNLRKTLDSDSKRAENMLNSLISDLYKNDEFRAQVPGPPRETEFQTEQYMKPSYYGDPIQLPVDLGEPEHVSKTSNQKVDGNKDEANPKTFTQGKRKSVKSGRHSGGRPSKDQDKNVPKPKTSTQSKKKPLKSEAYSSSHLKKDLNKTDRMKRVKGDKYLSNRLAEGKVGSVTDSEPSLMKTPVESKEKEAASIYNDNKAFRLLDILLVLMKTDLSHARDPSEDSYVLPPGISEETTDQLFIFIEHVFGVLPRLKRPIPYDRRRYFGHSAYESYKPRRKTFKARRNKRGFFTGGKASEEQCEKGVSGKNGSDCELSTSQKNKEEAETFKEKFKRNLLEGAIYLIEKLLERTIALEDIIVTPFAKRHNIVYPQSFMESVIVGYQVTMRRAMEYVFERIYEAGMRKMNLLYEWV